MSDDWLEKCRKAASLPLGDLSAFQDQDPTTPEPTSGRTPSARGAQGIEIGVTEDSIAIVLRNQGDKPQLIFLNPDDALTVAENLKRASMLLLFKKSLGGSGPGSKGSGPSDDSEPVS